MTNIDNFNIQSERYLSLDVLRGLTVALMIVVNTPGDWGNIYAPFKHSDWHGYTPTDWVFPAFLFVVGNAMSFSMGKLKKIDKVDFLKKVLKRSVIMFLIGLFLNSFPFVKYENGHYALIDLNSIRLWGVLQRIAVCYAIASIMVYYIKESALILVSIAMLLFYWLILYFCGDKPDPYLLETNAIRKLDLMYLEPKNIYRHYSVPFDPLGLLSTFPAVINVVAGYLTGIFIKKNGNTPNTVLKMSALGIGLVLVAMMWDILFPINKPLWTSTYVMISIGYCLIFLGLLMYIIEIKSVKKWTYFFEVFGKNPLFIYVMAWVVISLMTLIRVDNIPLKSTVYESLFASWLSPINASLLFSVVYMLLMWLIGYLMDKKKIYVKL